MSATILWQPIKGKSLGVGAPSKLLEALSKAFGQYSTLDEDCLERLYGMKATGAEVESLIEAIEEHGRISVWAEY